MTLSSKNKRILGITIYHGFCILFCFIMLYPLIWLFGSSFKESSEIFSRAEALFPDGKWHFENYAIGWKGFGGITFGTFFKNSFFVTITATLGAIFSSAIIAYGFAKIKFAGSKFWFACTLVSMMLPFQVIMIPQYLLFKRFGWVGTYAPLIVPHFFGYPFFIFLNVQFMKGIPSDLDDAAKIDGCNHFMTFARIYLPLLTSPLIISGIFSFIWRWEDFAAPLIYLNKPSKYVISIALKNFSDPSSMSNWGGMFAMSVLSILPVAIIYVAFQKYLVDGIATTGIKG